MFLEATRYPLATFISFEVEKSSRSKKVHYPQGNSHKITVTRKKDGDVHYRVEANQSHKLHDDENTAKLTYSVFNCFKHLFSKQNIHRPKNEIPNPVCFVITDTNNSHAFDIWLRGDKTEACHIYTQKPDIVMM
ncbi:hypothetical protein D5018_00445 [Parashewanella curva]|uniref:Uncharacterized protein n=1 Tax=Parashewanella curva TaxID=2338552 RepID=A0A3L8Q3V0_9GAMM|nr:hypothetical protein [Parashewanella curva]RLV61622.1 hypothetical protein D5018_00445 [Parashewanella curva]